MHSPDLPPPPKKAPEKSPPREHVPRSPRRRTCLTGKLVYGDGAFSADCTVRDISEAGAKITLPRRQLLPSEFYLIIVKYGVAHHATVKWSKFPARGLQFTDTHALSATMPADLGFLRLLWLGLHIRSGAHPATDQWAPPSWQP